MTERDKLIYLVSNAIIAYRSMDKPPVSEYEFIADFLLGDDVAIEEMVACKKCIHRGVCYLRETCNDIETHLKEFGCSDFIRKF